jgi:hypothetical protein
MVAGNTMAEGAMDRETYLHRVGRMQAELKQLGVDIALFADRENLIYYTG